MVDLPSEHTLIKFRDKRYSGTIVPRLLDFTARGILRFVGIVPVPEDADGSTHLIKLNEHEKGATGYSALRQC